MPSCVLPAIPMCGVSLEGKLPTPFVLTFSSYAISLEHRTKILELLIEESPLKGEVFVSKAESEMGLFYKQVITFYEQLLVHFFFGLLGLLLSAMNFRATLGRWCMLAVLIVAFGRLVHGQVV